tara:strand:+ start:10326 stop:11159 length:834 start_codon:yes stop_codon:yes gene_type:complete
MILAAIILSKDEEENIASAIDSLAAAGAAIFVVDSGSSDKTVEIAKSKNCVVAHRDWTNYADQFAWALDNCPFDADWYCRLDADEYLTSELIEELNSLLPTLPLEVSGLNVKRRVVFLGKWIRHGGVYPIWNIRFWRRGKGRIEDNMDEHIVVSSGEVHQLKNDLVDDNRKDLTFWINKHNYYATREAEDAMIKSHGDFNDLTGAQRTRRFMKTKVFYRFPLFLRAFLFWVYRYIFRLGFMDGTSGYLYHFLQGYWYRTLVDAKIREMKMKSEREAS